MKAISYPKCVRFTPWRGEKYDKGYLGKRVLVLGESHYAGSEADLESPSNPEETIELIHSQTTGESSISYFTRLAQAFTGKQGLSPSEKADLWSRLAFYNAIQTLLPGPGTEPTKEMWEAMPEPLKAVQAALKPEIIIAISGRLWDWLPFPPARSMTFQSRRWQFCDIQSPTTAVATWLPHPRRPEFGSGLKCTHS